MKKVIFTGAGVAIVTPMHADGSVNYEKLGEIIDFQIDHHTDCIVICGTTGESATLNHEEHVKVISYAVERTAHRVPVIAGAGSNDTAYAVELCKEAKAAGADALLSVTPYYNKTSQTGLIRHFNTIADATDLPVVLYNVPSRTGTCIAPATYQELAKHPNIVATKEACGNISDIAKTRALCGDELNMYSGDDNQVVPIMSLGGLGVISVLSNICPQETHDICQLFLDGKTKESAALQLKYLKLMNDMFIDVNPIPVKEAMNLMGMDVGPCRLPLVELSADAKAHLTATLKEYHLV
ncbi:MAG: 4-hydroxy-tetrahydrodipicolinate synthase [Oscillospiraceae bacterium]|jgi:4-hydroxy-tetrahydrodipicolinate synthase